LLQNTASSAKQPSLLSQIGPAQQIHGGASLLRIVLH
jgi:hypothetical protein